MELFIIIVAIFCTYMYFSRKESITNRKYELISNDTKCINSDIICYRIRALKDFGNVKGGDLGGYIGNVSNLSNKGTCWVEEGAVVCGFARVRSRAVIPTNETLYGDVTVNTTHGYHLSKWYRKTVIFKETGYTSFFYKGYSMFLIGSLLCALCARGVNI